MFIINLLLSLALSMLAVIAGLAGWALTSPATRSVLKKKVLKNPKILDSHSQILLKNGCGAPTNPYSGKADETTCSVNNQNGIYCNQDCKIDGVSYYSSILPINFHSRHL